MILGLRTVVYSVTDLGEGKAWYSGGLDRAPYFDEPFYVGNSVGGFEVGLVPDGAPSSVGVQAFWGVRDVEAEQTRLTDLGAVLHESIKDVGGRITTASLKGPFGNVFGLIEKPLFDRTKVQ